jgi:hypothetical protein
MKFRKSTGSSALETGGQPGRAQPWALAREQQALHDSIVTIT